MFPKFAAHSQRRGRRSSALVITLAALVLISAILLVFFEESTLNRQISFSSASQYRADITAHTAVDTIVGDLRTEIIAGSTLFSSSGTNIYVPTANSTVEPSQVFPTPGYQTEFPNLVKQSVSGSSFWSGAAYSGAFSPIRSAAANNSSTASLNGRYISTNEWNRPGLLGDPGTGETPTAASGYTPPDWVLVTRQGAVTNAPGQVGGITQVGTSILANNSVTNLNYVVGRYAYTIYNEGGLIDVNVAGHPTSGMLASDPFVTKRGTLPQVDLGNVPGVTDANALVNWRNAATASTISLYTNYVFNTTNGFTTVAGPGQSITNSITGITYTVPGPTGDRNFVTRQDLINYIKAQSHSGQVSSSALQYLGTFTRAINAPSYTATTATAYNPSLINTRVTTGFSQRFVSDRTQANVGEPLIKYRFPLSRLSWLTHTGPSLTAVTEYGLPVTAADIMNSFGLTYANGVWTYNHGSPNAIMTLTQVADAGREADFFELLQAAIGSGSLAQISNNGYANVNSYDGNSYFQILQIGANLIDQYNTDSYPRRIAFGTTLDPNTSQPYEIDGVENLPYLTRVFDVTYRELANVGSLIRPMIGFWLQPEVWNPHANATTLPTNGPTKFRFITVVTGAGLSFTVQQGTTGAVVPSPITPFPPAQSLASGAGVQFNNDVGFSTPTLLTPGGAGSPTDTAPNDNPTTTTSPGSFLGLCVGLMSAPDSPNNAGSTTYSNSYMSISGLATHELQYWDGTTWVTYDQMKYIETGLNDSSGGATNPEFNSYLLSMLKARSDPRTDRFGVFGGYGLPVTLNTTIRPNPLPQILNLFLTDGIGAQPAWKFGAGYWGQLSDNNPSSSSTYYADPDGVNRLAAGAYTSLGNFPDGYPLGVPNANPSSRPIMLNRPFRSVADMGYASRGMPWKELDFFTKLSADAALLDTFCTQEEPEVMAGQLDPNTRQAPVLAAVLQGAIIGEIDGETITTGEASNIAQALVTQTEAQPLKNRSELVTSWAQNISYLPTPHDNYIKTRREAAIRALSDISNTRTWNLLIDVVAQSGRYPTSAKTLDNFIVEGEHRYWVHLAIDRYTGEIVDQQWEPVNE